MKTILFLIARYPGYGGIEKVTTVLANQWVAKYHIVICSIDQQDEENLLSELDRNVVFYRMPYNGLKKSQDNVAFLNDIIKKIT